MSIFTVYLKNKNIIFKIRRSKVTDYAALNAFNRKSRLAEYFEGMEDEDISLVQNKSNFTPQDKLNGALEEYIDTVEKFPMTLHQTHINPT